MANHGAPVLLALEGILDCHVGGWIEHVADHGEIRVLLAILRRPLALRRDVVVPLCPLILSGSPRCPRSPKPEITQRAAQAAPPSRM